jgi:hypothetical protein
LSQSRVGRARKSTRIFIAHEKLSLVIIQQHVPTKHPESTPEEHRRFYCATKVNKSEFNARLRVFLSLFISPAPASSRGEKKRRKLTNKNFAFSWRLKEKHALDHKSIMRTANIVAPSKAFRVD